MAYNRGEIAAKALLQKFEIKTIPIDIIEIAKRKGLDVKPFDLGEVSGVLHINNDLGIIGFNPKDSKVRQRFTIAHELGHFQMHKSSSNLFIDNNFNQVYFRDKKSSTGELIKEQEANAFAAAILMPQDLLTKEIENYKFDLSDESAFVDLARLFNVSVQAMIYRISNLGLF
ncbi:MAG: ImmA/IrrE family metallo-endopeptidase [Bacteroidetes bacterium]|nr:ImmA/IrrE family metallo-endopeptidase [Bacteroidota bacterium]